MLTWISENIGSLLICAVLVLIVVGIIVKFIKDRRKGKSSCGCNCSHGAMAGTCHKGALPEDPKAEKTHHE